MKKIIFAAAAILCSAAYSQDFDDWGTFPDGTGNFQESGPSITFNAEGELKCRMYLDKPEYEGQKDSDYDSISDFPVTSIPSAKISASLSDSNLDAEIHLKFDEDTIKDYPQDIIDEMTIRGYFGNCKLEAGKMKVVWGKGDKLHVLDNFNADDYTDFIMPDYIDRRLSTPMLRAIYSFEKNDLRLEGIWTPYMEKDRFAEEGIWTPAAYTTLSSNIKKIVSGWDIEKAAQFKEDSIYPDTEKLKYTQAGLRLTGTTGAVDWGVSYYYGHYKQPSADFSRTLASAGTETPSLDYDWKQTFGVEAATVAGRFNLRGEFAYNLTDDIEGNDPWVRNNSIAWLAGFDFDIPVSNININIQETGTFIFKGNKIKDTKEISVQGKKIPVSKYYDVDYDEAGYTNNKLVFKIEDSWMNSRIVPEITTLWGIERGDLIVQPKIAYKPNGNLTMTLSGMYIHCKDKDSEFYEWEDNSLINIGINCKF
ncbi:hypothetical protein [Treponema sp.]|uniref:hypothetical protein n=1 Tax=Treponema sp. TaxID=166 RepID=UPI003F03FD11